MHVFHLCFLDRERVDLFGVKIPPIKTGIIGLGSSFVFPVAGHLEPQAALSQPDAPAAVGCGLLMGG